MIRFRRPEPNKQKRSDPQHPASEQEISLLIKERLRDGYYSRPDVLREIAKRLLDSLDRQTK